MGSNNGKLLIGLYEKALPASLSWEDRLSMTRDTGYSFMEISIDETDERLGRLRWDEDRIDELGELSKKIGVNFLTMCLSSNRSYPIGSQNDDVREKGVRIIFDAIRFALRLGIRIIQVACYDVLTEEESTGITRRTFTENLGKCLNFASSRGVMLAIENVDNEFGGSLDNIIKMVEGFSSPWLQLYPDIGNISAMGHSVEEQLKKYASHFVALHIKDTLPEIVRGIPFGQGNVDFVSALSSLKASGFYGPLLLEMWAVNEEDNFNIIKDSMEWVTDKLSQAGYL